MSEHITLTIKIGNEFTRKLPLLFIQPRGQTIYLFFRQFFPDFNLYKLSKSFWYCFFIDLVHTYIYQVLKSLCWVR